MSKASKAHCVVRTPYASWFAVDLVNMTVTKVDKSDVRVERALELNVDCLAIADVIGSADEIIFAQNAQLSREIVKLRIELDERRSTSVASNMDLVDAAAGVHSSAEVEKLERMIVEKDTVISDKDREVLDKVAVIESRDKTIVGLNQQIERLKSTPTADPAEIERLKQEIAKLTMEKSDALKAKDDRITALEKERNDAKSAQKKAEELASKNSATSQPASQEVSAVKKFYRDRTRTAWGITLSIAALLVFIMTSGVLYWMPASKFKTEVVSTTSVPADYDSIRSDLVTLKADKDSKEKRDATLSEWLKKKLDSD